MSVTGFMSPLGRKYIGCSGHEDAGSNGSGLRVWALCRSMINALSSGSLGRRSPPPPPPPMYHYIFRWMFFIRGDCYQGRRSILATHHNEKRHCGQKSEVKTRVGQA